MDVSFVNLVNGLLPFHKRLAKRLAFLRAFSNKADSIMQFIRDFRSEALMLAYTNCQRFRLEKHLNDVFDKSQRRILIIDNQEIGIIVGKTTEINYITIGLFSEVSYYSTFGFLSEQGYLTNQFKVIVPVGTNQNMILEDVNKYKLAGVKAIISN